MTKDPEKILLALLSKAEVATSDALRATRVIGDGNLAIVRNEVITKAVSLARTLLSESKRLVKGGPINRRGIVQGSGGYLDTLCAELAVLEEFEQDKQ